MEIQKKISLHGIDKLQLFGLNDSHLKQIENVTQAKIIARGNELKIVGLSQDVVVVENVITEMIKVIERTEKLTENDLATILEVVNLKKMRNNTELTANSGDIILYTKEGSIKPKTDGQKKYYESAMKNDVVFVIGPAGTGKTYLAVAIALTYLRDKIVSKIVLARPAVEAGESLGFLPGDLREKVDPYLKPLYDALFDMVIPAKLKKYMESEIIEIVPLAYMRGRTLNNAFIILDEAQNTNPNQMKMFLTRLGYNSKAIITGDITQIDLPNKKESGLIQIQGILLGIEGIDYIYLTNKDVVRHRLVREIVKAYEKYDNGNMSVKSAKDAGQI